MTVITIVAASVVIFVVLIVIVAHVVGKTMPEHDVPWFIED